MGAWCMSFYDSPPSLQRGPPVFLDFQFSVKGLTQALKFEVYTTPPFAVNVDILALASRVSIQKMTNFT